MTIAIDVAIGLMLVYLLLSLLVATLQELVAGLFAARAKHLYAVLSGLVAGTVPNGEGREGVLLVQALYNHPLIRSLTGRAAELRNGKPSLFGKGLPSYIPSQTFVIALLDMLRGTKAASDAVGAGELLASARKSLERVTEPELKRVLTLLVGDTEQLTATMGERSRLVSERLETWFNDRMSRASGWYKRRAHYWSLALGLVLSIAFNADTFRLAQQLWNDSALRSGAVAAAQLVRDSGMPAATGASLVERTAEQLAALQTSMLPLGWQHAPTLAQLPMQLLGWLVTTLAVSLGATFWFELLTKTLRFRSTGLRVSPATGKVAGAPVEVLS